MVGAIVGLLTLLCALVTGLLVWTAYGVYSGQNMAIQTLASKVLQLDLELADYGPKPTPSVRRCATVSARRLIRFGSQRERRQFRREQFRSGHPGHARSGKGDRQPSAFNR
jgi:hypothetical protein